MSGILTCALQFILSFLGRAFVSASDFVFGAAIGLYFWRFRGLRDGRKLIAFVLGSGLAFQVAIVTTMFSPPLRNILGFSSSSTELLPSDKFFFGGFVGAIILLASGYFFLSAWPRPKGFVLDALGLSIIGGALAILGWFLGPSLGLFFSKALKAVHLVGASSTIRANANAYSLFIIWQTGMAVLLGIALPALGKNVNHAEASLMSAPPPAG